MNGIGLLFLSDTKVSLDGRAVWEVRRDHGVCGCGQCLMTSPIAWFDDLMDANLFIVAYNRTFAPKQSRVI